MQVADVVEGRFELQAKAGTGGMGTVWRALDRTTDALVALKALRNPDEGDVSRFLNEARLLSTLEHPHVVRYIGHGLAPSGEPYLVMEWLEGEDLAQRLERGGLTIEETTILGSRAAGALGAAHARGVIHRDIKPSNLFLENGDVSRVRVLDFGIARSSGATGGLTQTGSVLGTPGYMAPEQARGERRIGTRADVFSLGCVLFECLTGRPAFQGIHAIALLAKLLLEEPPHVCDLCPEVPAALGELVAAMLAKNPAERPADGAAVESALEKLDVSTIGSVPPPARLAQAITETEKRLVSIVAVVPSIEVERPVSASGEMTGTIPSKVFDIEQAVRPLGAKVEVLANGTIIAMIAGTGTATDQTTVAARCALRMKAMLPGSPMALITGRSEATRRLPVGEVLEKAAALLENSNGSMEQGAHIDDVTRALLDTRFEVVESNGSVLLRSERSIGEEARTLLGKPSPFLGRDRELRSLCEQIQEAFEDKVARAILVTAPAGTGKSRLRLEVLRQLRDKDPNLAFSINRADSLSAGAAFALLGSGLRSSLGIETGEPIESQRDKVLFWVKMFVPSAAVERVAEFLGELVGASFPDHDSHRLRAARQNAKIMADQVEAAYVEFAGAIAQQRSTLVVIEDLHWGDAASVKLLDAALRDLQGKPFVVLAFARPEVHEVFPKLWNGRQLSEVRLSPLSRRASENLVKNSLGESADERTISAIVDRSEGNAFYLEELIRAFAEGRGEALPDTVLGMVEARLAGLPVEARRLLRAASVFGEVFWKNGLLNLLGEDGLAVDATLEHVVEREFVTKRSIRRFAGEDEYGFRHALVREGAYAMLAERDRTLGHKLAGEWLESVGEQDPVVLAEHFERSGMREKAARYHVQAAERALRGNDLQAAIGAAKLGLSAGLGADLEADLWAIKAQAAWLMGNHALAVTAAEQALQRAAVGSVSYCWALAAGLSAAMMVGRVDAIGVFMGALMTTEPTPDAVAVMAWALAPAASATIFGGQQGTASIFLNRLRALAAAGVSQPSVVGSMELAAGFWERFVTRNIFAALASDTSAEHHFGLAGDQPTTVLSSTQRGGDLALLGAFDEAESHLRAILDRVRSGTMAALLATYAMAHVALEKGTHEEAVALAERVLEQGKLQGESLMTAAAHLVLADAWIAQNKLDMARDALDRSGAGTSGLYLNDIVALGIRARLLLARGRSAEAAEQAEDAIAIARKAGVYDLRFDATLITRAEAYHAAGNTEAAKVSIREARADLLTRADKIDDLKYRRSFLEQVPVHARTLELAKVWLGEET